MSLQKLKPMYGTVSGSTLKQVETSKYLWVVFTNDWN